MEKQIKTLINWYFRLFLPEPKKQYINRDIKLTLSSEERLICLAMISNPGRTLVLSFDSDRPIHIEPGDSINIIFTKGTKDQWIDNFSKIVDTARFLVNQQLMYTLFDEESGHKINITWRSR